MTKPRRSVQELGRADHIRATAESISSAAGSALAASWRRSLVYHDLDPETRARPDRVPEVALREARERLGALPAIAVPTLERLFGAVRRSGCCVLLTDSEGLIVERQGNAGDDEAFEQIGLRQGAVWSEANEGTNGIGTCLVEQRPVVIYRDQHFHTRNTMLSCTGAPIFDENARLAAVLDISSCQGELTEDFVHLIATLIADAARRIESDNFRAAFPDCRIVMAPAHGAQGSALLAVDRYDLVIGATRRARKTLNLTEKNLASAQPLPDILANSRQASDLRAAEGAELQRALARNEGNVSATARELGLSRATLYRRMHRLGLGEGRTPKGLATAEHAD